MPVSEEKRTQKQIRQRRSLDILRTPNKLRSSQVAKRLEMSSIEEVIETTTKKRRSDFLTGFDLNKNAESPTKNIFREFLKKTSRVIDFRAFLQKEYSEENLDFWIEVETYRQHKIMKQKKMAPIIFDKYIRVGSDQEINIDENTRAITKLELKEPDDSTFITAQQSIFTLMERDSFQRFLLKQSEEQVAVSSKPAEERRRRSVSSVSKKLEKFKSHRRSIVGQNTSNLTSIFQSHITVRKSRKKAVVSTL